VITGLILHFTRIQAVRIQARFRSMERPGRDHASNFRSAREEAGLELGEGNTFRVSVPSTTTPYPVGATPGERHQVVRTPGP
jgi:hypothetical protein